jgi:hypothetical protein
VLIPEGRRVQICCVESKFVGLHYRGVSAVPFAIRATCIPLRCISIAEGNTVVGQAAAECNLAAASAGAQTLLCCEVFAR